MGGGPVKAVRRLGSTPKDLGNTTGVSGSPDILELDDGGFAVIGANITAELGETPLSDARCAPNERIVRIPRNTLVAARKDIPEE